MYPKLTFSFTLNHNINRCDDGTALQGKLVCFLVLSRFFPRLGSFSTPYTARRFSSF